jgi:hypothetical protein
MLGCWARAASGHAAAAPPSSVEIGSSYLGGPGDDFSRQFLGHQRLDARASSAGRSPSAFDAQIETNGGGIQGREWKIRDPKLVVRKAARVARPGGTVVIFDADYATMTSGVDREMDERIISGVIANPRVMRAMPRLLREVGLKLVDSRGWVLTEIGRADFFLASLQSYPVLLPKAGVASLEETQAFVARQLRASEEGTFFAGYNFYAMIAERPLQ